LLLRTSEKRKQNEVTYSHGGVIRLREQQKYRKYLTERTVKDAAGFLYRF
jgi:hypothetical protein